MMRCTCSRRVVDAAPQRAGESFKQTISGIVALVLSLLLTMAASASAQTTGGVTGTVVDAQKGAIPGATVTLSSDTKGTTLGTTVTNERGGVRVPEHPPGQVHGDGRDAVVQDAEEVGLRDQLRAGHEHRHADHRGRRRRRDRHRDRRDAAGSDRERREVVHGEQPADGVPSNPGSRLRLAAPVDAWRPGVDRYVDHACRSWVARARRPSWSTARSTWTRASIASR